MTLSTPEKFFTAAESEYPDAPVWSGELYLEFHRGTYTSQSRTKRGNRRCEHLLREVELWATLASIRNGDDYPYDELDAAWRIVLLQQFHDILPGTSISWVHREAERNYASVASPLEGLISASLRSLAGSDGDLDHQVLFNAGPYRLHGVQAMAAAMGAVISAGSRAVAEMLPDAESRPEPVGFEECGGCIVLGNGRVRAVVDERGLLVSIRDLVADRELVPKTAAANLLMLFQDTPNQWDAWDIDDHYRNSVIELTEVDSMSVASDESGVTVRVARSFGRSSVVQSVSLAPGSSAIDIVTRVAWHETQKLLKLEFPLDVHADRTAAEIQFGHIFRPTHSNTSWDAARFETVGHRWVHVGETGYGVAIANDSTYGFDSRRTSNRSGGTTTTVRLSLLKAPLFPDPSSDQGEHEFRHSIRVGAQIADAIAEGYRLNLPLRSITGGCAVEPIISVDDPALVVEAVKMAEDRSGDVIVRLYEAFGSRVRSILTCGFEYETVVETDLLERVIAAEGTGESDPCLYTEEASQAPHVQALHIQARSFQIITLRFRRG